MRGFKFFCITSLILAYLAGGLLVMNQKSNAIDAISIPTTKSNQTNDKKVITSAGGKVSSIKSVSTVSEVPKCSLGVMPVVTQPSSKVGAGLYQTLDSNHSYNVYGNTPDQIKSQILSCSPAIEDNHRYASLTNYSLSWSAEYVMTADNLCKTNNVSVSINIAQVFPNWVEGSTKNSSTEAYWKNFSANLATHENGHVSVDNFYAAQLYDQIVNFPPTSCLLITSQLNKLADTNLATLKQANVDYDTRTNHGVSQGATF